MQWVKVMDQSECYFVFFAAVSKLGTRYNRGHTHELVLHDQTLIMLRSIRHSMRWGTSPGIGAESRLSDMMISATMIASTSDISNVSDHWFSIQTRGFARTAKPASKSSASASSSTPTSRTVKVVLLQVRGVGQCLRPPCWPQAPCVAFSAMATHLLLPGSPLVLA